MTTNINMLLICFLFFIGSHTIRSSGCSWNYCATENQRCDQNSDAIVRYGAEGHFAYRMTYNGIDCNNSKFGDPRYGVVKSCSYIPLHYDDSKYHFNFAAKEGETYNYKGNILVNYGFGSKYTTKEFNDGGVFECSNSEFGDPYY